MESNLLFDLTTDEDAKNADSLLVRLGWILPIALFSGPLGFAAVAISAVAGAANITTVLDKQKQAAIELIRAGKENGVKRMTIVLDETVGLDLGTSLEGIPIKCRLGKLGRQQLKSNTYK
jgi:hypothetical protein